jgi:hypothetical protein
MGVNLFGVDVPIIELLVLFSTVVVIYLIIMEFEFRQLRVITRKFDDEEVQLDRAMKELKDEFVALREVMAAKKMK